jgi:glutamine synthetase
MTDGHSPYPLANPLSALLGKPCADFRRTDMLRVIERLCLQRITFHYTGLDGRLKELAIPVIDRRQVDTILADGERVDGSSLFEGMIDVGLSDLYVVPVYRTAFLDPFVEGSLGFVCRYLARDGRPAPVAPDGILSRAARLFSSRTGLELRALGELEFYLLGRHFSRCYPCEPQRGYHGSSPFTRGADILDEMMRTVARVTGAVKYAHAEVGCADCLASEREEIQGAQGQQMEIEFLPRPVEEMADDLVIGRWLIRTVAARHGCIATFAPKLEEGAAGSGLHVHLELLRDGQNVMCGPAGGLSGQARALVGGLCEHADSLTSFGNTVAASYLRLAPDHEAPTRICWSDNNRSALVRVPLGWSTARDLGSRVNPGDPAGPADARGRQTVELRSPDGSANIHLVLAGITMAADWAFQPAPAGFSRAGPLELADRLYVRGNIQQDADALSRLPSLPSSCAASSRVLGEKRALYERDGVFPSATIDYVRRLLEAEGDETLRQRLAGLPDRDRLRETRRVMHANLHRH